MRTPNPAFDVPLVDKDGKITAVWQGLFSQLLTGLQQNFSLEGIVTPSLSTSNIALLTSITKTPNGTLVYDSDTNQEKVKINGTFKVITTS